MNFKSEDIKKIALSLGFSACGIAKAEPLTDEKKRFSEMLQKGYYANLRFLERDIAARFSPELILPGCKSVIVVLYNYLTDKILNADYKIAKYSFIKDYHILIKEKLSVLVNLLQKENPDAKFKITVDTSCISEKNWAVKAGLGSIGKNSLLQTPQGSFFLIGIVLTDLVFDYDVEKSHSCGNCSRCVDSCPTGAIVRPYQLNVEKCISYHTIESKVLQSGDCFFDNWVYGCDCCQDVCPNNKKSQINPEAVNYFSLFLHFQNTDFENLSEDDFSFYFRDSCVKRQKYELFKNRIIQVKKNLNR